MAKGTNRIIIRLILNSLLSARGCLVICRQAWAGGTIMHKELALARQQANWTRYRPGQQTCIKNLTGL